MAAKNTRDIRTRLTIEGEDKYKAALKSNAAEAANLKAQMELLTEQFADNAESQEYLTKRGELLARQQENAAQKAQIYAQYTDAARESAERMAEGLEKGAKQLEREAEALERLRIEQGETSDAFQEAKTAYDTNRAALEKQEKAVQSAGDTITRLDTAMTKAQTQTEKFASALKQGERAADDMADGTDSLSDVLSELGNKLGVDVPQEALQFIDSFSAMDAGVAGATGGILAAVGLIVKGMQELLSITQESAAAASDIMKISQNYGIAVETLQEYRYAASMLGVELDDLLDAYSSLVSFQGEAAAGNEEATEIFRDMGISIYDTTGRLKDTNEVMFEVFESLGKMRNETERNVLTQKIFGEEAIRLNGIIKDGGQEFRRYADEATNVGYVIREEDIKALDELEHAQKRNELQSEKIRNEWAVNLAPAAKGLAETINFIKEGFNDLAQLDIAKAFHFEEIADAWTRIFNGESIGSIAKSRASGHAAGTPYFNGGQTLVGEYGPEMVTLPKGARIQNANDTAAAMSGSTVYVTINANIPDARALEEIIDFYKNYQLTRRKGLARPHGR